MMKRNFTLIEVVVSIAILGLSLAGLLQLLTQSQLRIANARDKWMEMHMLTQGAEYLLMTSNTEELSVPDEVFPYEDYQIDCNIEDAEGLPEELVDQSGQLPLKKWTISLIRVKDRKECLSVVIDRLGYEEAENVQ
jgi:prepilin-type N-terminal cleavage/methylation domain-containing protein